MENSETKFVLIESLLKMAHWEYYVSKVVDYSSRYNYSNSYYYAPGNLVGKYEKYPSYGDFPEAYCLRSYGNWWKKSQSYQLNYRPQDFDPLGAEDYVTLEFENVVVPRDICIYEICNPGAVVRIWGKLLHEMKCSWILLWEGAPRIWPHKSRVFQPRIRQINHLINTIRLEFNQSHLQYHYSIDAVVLGGYRPVSKLEIELMRKGMIKNIKKESKSKIKLNLCLRRDGDDFSLKLPFEVMIHIFQYLDLKSLSRCARVSKRWNEASADSFLYQNLNLKPYWYLVNCDTINHFINKCTCLRKLDLSWCGSDVEGYEKVLTLFIRTNSDTLTHLSLGNCKCITFNVMLEISRCKELVDLRLKNAYPHFHSDFRFLHSLNKLVSLDLTASEVQDEELISILMANPHLKHIIIDSCENLMWLDRVAETVVEYNKNLTTWSSWKTLSLTSDGIRLFGDCHNITELDLGWCLINQDPGNCLKFIAHGCSLLKRLILSEWRGLTDNQLMPLILSCKELTQLDLLGVVNITGDICEKALKCLPKLRLLEISFCDAIREDEVTMWRQQYPHITIQRSGQYEVTNLN